VAACTHEIGTADTGATPNASGAFTPVVGDLLVVFLLATGSVASAATCTSSVGGFTFTAVAQVTRTGGSESDLWCFISDQLVTSATSQTVSCSTASAANGTVIFVCAVAGMTLTGAAALRQVASTASVTGGATPAPAFAVNALTSNPTLGLVGNNSSPAGMTPPTGWTEPATTGDLGYTVPTSGAAYCFRDSGFANATITWGSTTATLAAVMIIELDASNQPALVMARNR
jgi:hypothetical protein